VTGSPHHPLPGSLRAERSARAALRASVSRRRLLGGAAALGGASLLAGCGSSLPAGTVTVGSSQSDAVPKAAFRSMMDAFSGGDVKINTIDHETFKASINNYLQGGPDDVFTWFAGYRARSFSEAGLVSDLSQVWQRVEGMPESMKVTSTDDEGRQIFIPSTYYPWAMFFRPSVWEARGWTPPTTWDEWITLCDAIAAEGMTPIAMANKDGWEAMGTFDQLNLRVNGYDFHVSLMAGDESWDSDAVRQVFAVWEELLPYHQEGALGRTWQEAAGSVLREESAMYLQGMYLSQQWAESSTPDDLDFFMVPEYDPAIGAGVVEAPVDGFMMPARPRDRALAEELLLYLSTPEAVAFTLEGDPSVIGANSQTDTSSYTPLQVKAAQVIDEAEAVTSFLDRDTRPDFATTVLNPALRSFMQNPSDLDAVLRGIEAQKPSLFGK